MDTANLQTSFIPNKNITGLSQDESGGGIVSVIGITLFVITVVASIGVYGYQKYLESTIANMDGELSSARETLDPALISQITQTNTQFISANELIAKHQVPSSFFSLLQSLTLKTVRFSSLSYSIGKTGLVEIKMKGSARSYATVAQQAKVFGDSPLFIAPQFSNLDLDKNGDVVFNFQAQIDKKVTSYEVFINGANPVQAQPAPILEVATTTPSTPVATTTTKVVQPVSTTTKQR